MQRYIAALCALVVLACVTGCGGGSSSSEPTLLPTVALKATDFYGKTFYVTPVDATSLGGYQKIQFNALDPAGPTSNVVQWSSIAVKTGEPVLANSGTWNAATIATDKILVLTTSAIPAVTRKFTLIQKESSYWLMYEEGTNKTSRLYFENTIVPALTSIQAYQGAIIAPSATPNAVKLGGSIQGTPAAPLNAAFSNVSTVAGIVGVTGSKDGIGTAASFNLPTGIATDGTYLYVADRENHIIRKIDIATKAVALLAGTPTVSGITNSYDGTGLTANFSTPSDVTIYGTYLYVADTGNNAIRRVDTSSGVVTLIAGSTSSAADAVDSLNGTDARFNQPAGITTDGTNLYVADYANHTIRKIVISTGAVVTLAGSAKNAGSSDSTDGTGASARFNFPARLTTDGTYLYVTDSLNCTIRKVAIATGAVTTLAGSAGSRESIDGIGSAARFYQPNGITTDGTYLYVTDYYAINTDMFSTIRRIKISTGDVTTIVRNRSGSADGPVATASFYSPIGITTNGISLYVVDRSNNLIRRINP